MSSYLERLCAHPSVIKIDLRDLSPEDKAAIMKSFEEEKGKPWVLSEEAQRNLENAINEIYG